MRNYRVHYRYTDGNTKVSGWKVVYAKSEDNAESRLRRMLAKENLKIYSTERV